MVRLQNSQTTSLRSKTRDENSTLVPLVGTVGSFPPGFTLQTAASRRPRSGRGWWRRAVQAERFAGPAGVHEAPSGRAVAVSAAACGVGRGRGSRNPITLAWEPAQLSAHDSPK